jgi:transcriptional regulator with XRE-family HTH domain
MAPVHGGVVIREARRRAGLSQRTLAERLGRDQSVVARWEALITSPTYETVADACLACGFNLDLVLRPVDEDQERVLQEQLRRTPAERVASVVNLAALRSRGA